MLQYYLAGWHIKPKGVKKPCVVLRADPSSAQPPDDAVPRPLAFIRYNPILGEFFRCKYQYADGTKGFYIAEQGEDPSSHPPPELDSAVPPVYALPCVRVHRLRPGW